MKGRQKAIFSFLFFIAFFQLNLCLNHFSLLTFRKSQAFFAIIFNNWGKTVVFLSVSTIWTVKYSQKLGIFKFLFLFHFVVVFYTLSSYPLPARPLFLIVLHNGVKKHSCGKAWFVTWYQNGELRALAFRTGSIFKTLRNFDQAYSEPCHSQNSLFRHYSAIFWPTHNLV